MLAQTIVGAIECGGVALFLPANVIVVKLFLELVEFGSVAIGDEKARFP